MNVEVKTAGTCRRNLEIEVDAEQVGNEYRKLLDEYSKEADLSGFRKGKAPREMVEKRYSKELREDTKKHLVSDAYQEALKQEDLDVLAVTDVQDEELNPESQFKFTVTLDVAPEFKLPNYSGIKIKGRDTDPSDEDVENALRHLLEQYATYEEVEERPIQKDDMAKIDYTATVEGRPLGEVAPESADMERKEDYWVLVNENAFLPEMEAGLIGCNIGAEKEIEVQFGAEFPEESLAGKKALYQVRVKAIRGKQIPELSTDILQHFDVESAEELKDKIRENLADAASQRENSRLRDEICSYLLKKTKFDVPESQVQNMMESVIKDIVRASTRQGASREDIEAKRDEIFAEARKTAAERIKLVYILDEIAKAEGVEAGEEDVSQYMEEGAQHYGVPVEQFRNNTLEHSSLEDVKASLKSDKTLDMLLEKAIVKIK